MDLKSNLTVDQATIVLLRHQLASVDLSDIEEEEMSETERAEYCAAIAAVWPRLEKDIKKLLHEQLMYASQQAEIWERVLFARGTFNGIDLLKEKWLTAYNEHKAKHIPPEDFDQHAPIGEVGN